MKTPEQIAEDVYRECVLNYRPITEPITEAIHTDRAQRSNRLILAVPSAGWRVWVDQPADVFDQITQLLDDGYTLDQIEWE